MSAPLKDIGGRTFSFGWIPARNAFTLQLRLVRLLGEPLTKAIAGVAGAAGSKDGKTLAAVASALQANPDALAAAIRSLAERMDPDDVVSMAEEVLASVRCNGAPAIWEATFQGKPLDVWKVLAEAMRVNFADFFSALPSTSPQGETASP